MIVGVGVVVVVEVVGWEGVGVTRWERGWGTGCVLSLNGIEEVPNVLSLPSFPQGCSPSVRALPPLTWNKPCEFGGGCTEEAIQTASEHSHARYVRSVACYHVDTKTVPNFISCTTQLTGRAAKSEANHVNTNQD